MDKRTPWFPEHVKPVRKGRYECQRCQYGRRHYFNGSRWLFASDFSWRGLANKRGAEAARVAVIEGDDEHWLWMSKADIARNMMAFGRDPELVKAHNAYGSKP